MRDNKKDFIYQLLFTILIIIFITVSLFIFIRANDKQIVQNNIEYVSDATRQSSHHISDVISTAHKNMYMLSYFQGSVFEDNDFYEENFKDVADRTPFDRIIYADENGECAVDENKNVNISERAYFRDAMDGNSGVEVIDEPQIFDEPIFVFYAPVYGSGRIIGVLNGIYTSSTLERFISASFFNEPASSFICDDTGKVLISTSSNDFENILSTLSDYNGMDSKTHNELVQAFKGHTSYSYRYSTGKGVGNACASPIEGTDWMYIQVFPVKVTNIMINRSNKLGIMLVCSVIAAFIAFIIFLVVMKQRQARRLMNENDEISQIIKSVTNIFIRFALIDLKNNTYTYLEKTDGMPVNGKYSDLVEYVNKFYIDEEDTYSIKEMISAENIRKNLSGDKQYVQYEYHINRNGNDRWEHAAIICLKREKGVPVSVLYAIQDVTQLKQAELKSKAALKNAFEAAEAANRAKSDFLSRMSHDIRTPMNAVMGMTAVAAMNLDDKERLTDCLNKINTSSKHLLALINDILDMSKIESGKVTLSEEPFNIAEMTESLLTIMHPQIKAKNQNISMNSSNIVHEDVIGDTLRLRQVFVNIMGNAVKFTPEGGSISLDIREIKSHIKGKACFEFEFKDNGIGMEEEFIDEIFEPFARSNNSVSRKIEGTGLGMPIARNIVRMMDGNIKVKSKLGEGSVFTVVVYLTIQNVSESDTRYLENLKILVADDEKDAAENTGEILKSIGVDASWVLSGDEAVERVVDSHNRSDDYAAVILDWKMPGKSGVDTAREIRQKIGSDVPIIILSAYDWADVEQEARDAGVNAFIAKPLFRSRLIYVLSSLMEEHKHTATDVIDDFALDDYSGKRILLVEDNELNREVASELLGMMGIEVEEAFDGQIAVDTVNEKPAGYYDLIFMDIQMPNKNGYEAAREIRSSDREDLKNIPIIAMSADAFSDDIYRSIESGMNDHVSKPIEISKLKEAIKKWLK